MKMNFIFHFQCCPENGLKEVSSDTAGWEHSVRAIGMEGGGNNVSSHPTAIILSN
jgi:hypothetical protein